MEWYAWLFVYASGLSVVFALWSIAGSLNALGSIAASLDALRRRDFAANTHPLRLALAEIRDEIKKHTRAVTCDSRDFAQ